MVFSPFNKLQVTKISSILRMTGKVRRSTETQSRGQKLMQAESIIHPGYSGSVFLLPLALKALDKLICVTDFAMKSIDAQKVVMPTLIPKALLEKTGRWGKIGSELLTLTDRNQKEFCLSPTHEEPVTDLFVNLFGNSFPRSNFPVKIYQITNKFRDEMRTKHGMLRGREFLMKDMYSFHDGESSAQLTYKEVEKAYRYILQTLELPFVQVEGSSGNMGGSFSQEMHILTDIGEDELHVCSKCSYSVNSELSSENNCSRCGSEVDKLKSIEVGHLFLLGDTYSRSFNAQFRDESGNLQNLYMGCYGFGVTRMLATAIECLSTETHIRWPLKIAPYLITVIPPKKGSKEEAASTLAYQMAERLAEISNLNTDVTFDDRTNLTIGGRMNDLITSGFPYFVIAGKKAVESVPKFEIVDVYNDKIYFLTHAETTEFFENVAAQQASCKIT